jgi:hypothetical protein
VLAPGAVARRARVWSWRDSRVASSIVLGCCTLALVVLSVHESLKYPERKHFGDDAEYLLAAESIVRHGSVEYRPEDAAAVLSSLPKHWRYSLIKKYRPQHPEGYFAARHGRLIGWHFPTYAALVAPVKLLAGAHESAGWAFHVTNLLWFCAGLLGLLQLWRAPRLWVVLLPLAFMTPALWFLPLVHTEAFVFACGLLALSCYLAEHKRWALAFTALAATQFQPIALCALALCAENMALVRGRARLGYAASNLALAGIAFVPGLFYRHYCGTPSLVSRAGFAAGHLMSFAKLASLFFDLNTGMVVYLPGVLLLLLLSLASALRRAYRQRTLWPLAPFVVLAAAFAATTTARIWNYHTQGIARYALYLTPQALLVIARELRLAPRISPAWIGAFACALALQIGVHTAFGWFDYRGDDNLHHNAVARFVLERWPKLYAPPPEIFCSRTRHSRCWLDFDTGYVENASLPAIWIDSHGRPLKALVQACDADATLSRFWFSPGEVAAVRSATSDCKSHAPRYVNFR